MYELKVLKSLNEFAQIQQEWDVLWERSDCTLPTSKAVPITLFAKTFAPDREWRIVTVREGGELVGALPLVLGKRRGVSIAELPNNSWCFCGDLLLHTGRNRRRIVKQLIRGLDEVGALAIWLDWIPVDSERWQLFHDHVRQTRNPCFSKPRFKVAEIPVVDSMSELSRTLSKNHRKKMKQARRRLGELGEIELVDFSLKNWERQMEAALAIEHRSWKGEAGSSLNANPEIAAFFMELASELIGHNQFALQFLQLDGQPIAFDLGYIAKGRRASHKISFEPKYARMSPGQVLVQKQLEQAISNEQIQSFDTIGPVTEAVKKWTDQSYTMGRIYVSTSHWASKLTVQAMGNLSSMLKRFRSPDPSEIEIAIS